MPSINTNQHLMNKSVAASGAATFSCGDTVAILLESRPLDAVQELAARNGIETAKYFHLNPGHQRMILGNMLRKKFRAEAKAFKEINIGSGADADSPLGPRHVDADVDAVFDDWTRILDSVVVPARAARAAKAAKAAKAA